MNTYLLSHTSPSERKHMEPAVSQLRDERLHATMAVENQQEHLLAFPTILLKAITKQKPQRKHLIKPRSSSIRIIRFEGESKLTGCRKPHLGFMQFPLNQ